MKFSEPNARLTHLGRQPGLTAFRINYHVILRYPQNYFLLLYRLEAYLTTTTLLPVSRSLATVEASLPIRWPRPSRTIALGDIPGILLQ